MDVVSRRWMWVESMGVASGCGCKEVYRFPHITYPSILFLYLFFFAAASLLFVLFLICFLILSVTKKLHNHSIIAHVFILWICARRR